MARFNLKMLHGLERPAIAALWPTLRGESIVLDVGASIGGDAQHLIDLASMGSAMARVLFDLERPTVGLLNIGVEEIKGQEPIREAGQRLREHPLPHMEYLGFVEGDDIGKGTADVVVTEGFAGNIALKTAEGTARQLGSWLRSAMTRTLRARIGYLFARQAFRTLREKMDPRKANGGVFLGLNGVVIKSHGGTDPEGFAAAIDMGYDMARYELLTKIGEALGRAEPESALAPEGTEAAAPAATERSVTILRSVILGCGAYLAGAGPHQCRTGPARSIRPTNGSCSAPASASGTSPPTAN